MKTIPHKGGDHACLGSRQPAIGRLPRAIFPSYDLARAVGPEGGIIMAEDVLLIDLQKGRLSRLTLNRPAKLGVDLSANWCTRV